MAHRNTVGAASLLEGRGGGVSGCGRDQASLMVVRPSPDDFIELVPWRERPLHIPVSLDLVRGAQGSLSHTASQQTPGCPDCTGRGGPLWGRQKQELGWGFVRGQR